MSEFSKSGNNSIVIDGGSNSLLNVNDLKSYKDSFKDFDYLLLQNEINQEVNEYLINRYNDSSSLLETINRIKLNI